MLALFIQKEWKSPARHPFDWRGFVAIALFMPLAIYALARGNSPTNHDGWASPTVIGCFAVAAVALAYFVRTELRSPRRCCNCACSGSATSGFRWPC